MSIQPIRTDLTPDGPYGPEHDSCALYLSARRNGESTFGTLKRALWRLANMGHRTGYVRGEGDGAGVQTDIPRGLWAKKLSKAGLFASLATQPGFWVGHLFLPHDMDFSTVEEEINRQFSLAGLNLLLLQPGPIRSEALAASAQLRTPSFWQMAGNCSQPDLEARLYDVKTYLEDEFPIHFASLSSYTVVYKMRGSVETLSRYYPELQDRNFDTVMALCHARYSTNTVSNFERAQPFALLGHNGEINTINRFRKEADLIGTKLPRNGSDSQDVDRLLESFCVKSGLNLMEAMEVVFPPSPYEIQQLPPPLRDFYVRLTQAFGPFAQGPAAIAARYGDMAICSLDTLGLRPLWFSETEKEFIFSSERGAVQMEDMLTDSRPFAPGEKMGLHILRGEKVEVLMHRRIRQCVLNSTLQREGRESWDTGFPVERREVDSQASYFSVSQYLNHDQPAKSVMDMTPSLPANRNTPFCNSHTNLHNSLEINNVILSASGWNAEQIQEVREISQTGSDPVGSLGFDGPLAVLSQKRVNLADYFKESVAVVTNPAIDRGREMEVFSTQTVIGIRPEIGTINRAADKFLVLQSPLLRSHPAAAESGREPGKDATLADLEEFFADNLAVLPLSVPDGQSMREMLNQLAASAVQAVKSGAACLILDDHEALLSRKRWLDPLLAVAAVDNALCSQGEGENLRRKCGIVVRSASIRNLHDITLLCSFGADAIEPYAMTAIAYNSEKDDLPEQANAKDYETILLANLRAGLEKVISTVGCHELRGYGRICGSIGLSPEIGNIFHSPNFLGSARSGLNWAELECDAEKRLKILQGVLPPEIPQIEHVYPKFWKSVNDFVYEKSDYQQVIEKYQEITSTTPVALRHLIKLKTSPTPAASKNVDISVNGYNLPLIISAMSFGSQGERAFKAYASAARKLNIICINGEGGELPDVLGLYPHNRGQQVASGRFGVNSALLNSCDLIEIKIGQGAKPGEGGMLPGEKVNPKVAQARHTPPFVALLSPSNNHDLYSIEDLAQLVEELKTVNPQAHISVKCPCVPGIGVIAVGIAKAGADIINLSGYDGATGAARKHAIQYVGLPAEIGVIQAHRALVESGIRDRVEIWCDGGMKTGLDVVKMILLGANRVGFATMAMLALGCTVCRKCNQGTCHKGITTHIASLEEAKSLGLKSFALLDEVAGVERLVRLFSAIGEEIRQLTAGLGAENLQDLVGKADLLEQCNLLDKIDLTPIFSRVPVPGQFEREPGVGLLLTRDRNQLTRYISEAVLKAVGEGEREVTYQDEVMAYDRALGSHLFGALTRQPELSEKANSLHLRFSPSSIGGNGFAAWSTDGTDLLIEGGAQDGVAKGASGGRVAIMKGLNHDGLRIDGSVGKSFAYGAQSGILIVQGDADSRACIRLSGADVIFGGMITHAVDDSSGSIGSAANLKGFACEYMTSGHVVILGDPGPYAFSGMTGGIVFQMLTPELGFTREVLQSRVAFGAHVRILGLEDSDIPALQELLGYYCQALRQTDQAEIAEKINRLCLPHNLISRFLKIVPQTTESLYHS